MRRNLLLATSAAMLALTGCGGGDDDPGASLSAADQAGAKIFADAGCAGCHTLSAADSKADVGPNLDSTQLSQARIVRQVANGGNGMPAFRGKLTQDQIDQVAAFVAASAKGSGTPVVGKFEPDDTELADCKSGSFECYEQAFGNVAYSDGPKQALTRFDQEMRTNRAVLANCHRIAHAIGAAAVAKYDGDVAEPFVQGSASCGSGYYHGLIERAFVGIPEGRLAVTAAEICNDPKIREVGFVAYQCVHGLGHGLMLYSGYDLPESLRVCDQLGNSFDQVSCTGGVFMENGQSSYGVKSRWLKDDDLIYPCNVVKEKHKYYCYLLVTSRILPAVGGSLEKTAQACRKSERDWIDECFESFGRDVSGIARQNGDRIIPLCKLAGRNEDDCIYGAARDIANNDANGRRAARFCDKVVVSAREHCFEGVGTILGGFHTYANERRAACAAVTRRYVDACARGAGVR